MSTALGVSPDKDGNGVTPVTHRRIIASQWHNTGVIDGLAVTGGNDLAYHVAAGVAVCQRTQADGKTLAYWAGGATKTVAAGDASNPRIDRVWIQSHDQTDLGDADSQVTIGVTQGTAAASPVAPAAPAGVTTLALMRMPAGATRTSAATQTGSTDWAIPYGATLGLLGEDKNTYTGLSNDKGTKVPHLKNTVTIRVPTDRIVELEWKGCASDAKSGVTGGDYISLMDWFEVDGTPVDGSAAEFDLNVTWQQLHHTHILKLTKGTHTVRSWYEWRGGNWEVYWHAGEAGGTKGVTYPGAILRVWDRGVAV